MLFGIKYQENKQGLKIVNKSLNQFGSAFMFRNGNVGLFFTNLFEAFKTAKDLGKFHKNIKYSVYKLTKQEEQLISLDKIVKTKQEYDEKKDVEHQRLMKKIYTLIEQNKQKTQTEIEK